MMKATVRTDFSKGYAYEKKVERGLDMTTREIADAIVNDIRASWSEESPSAYGEAPAKVTGTLDRSVKREKTGRTGRGTFTSHGNAIAYAIDIKAPYAGILEDGPLFRPYFEPALIRASALYAIAYRRLF